MCRHLLSTTNALHCLPCKTLRSPLPCLYTMVSNTHKGRLRRAFMIPLTNKLCKPLPKLPWGIQGLCLRRRHRGLSQPWALLLVGLLLPNIADYTRLQTERWALVLLRVLTWRCTTPAATRRACLRCYTLPRLRTPNLAQMGAPTAAQEPATSLLLRKEVQVKMRGHWECLIGNSASRTVLELDYYFLWFLYILLFSSFFHIETNRALGGYASHDFVFIWCIALASGEELAERSRCPIVTASTHWEVFSFVCIYLSRLGWAGLAGNLGNGRREHFRPGEEGKAFDITTSVWFCVYIGSWVWKDHFYFIFSTVYFHSTYKRRGLREVILVFNSILKVEWRGELSKYGAYIALVESSSVAERIGLFARWPISFT
jgi:hypothetical protein